MELVCDEMGRSEVLQYGLHADVETASATFRASRDRPYHRQIELGSEGIVALFCVARELFFVWPTLL